MSRLPPPSPPLILPLPYALFLKHLSLTCCRGLGGMEALMVVVGTLASGIEGPIWWLRALAIMDTVQGRGMPLGLSQI